MEAEDEVRKLVEGVLGCLALIVCPGWEWKEHPPQAGIPLQEVEQDDEQVSEKALNSSDFSQ